MSESSTAADLPRVERVRMSDVREPGIPAENTEAIERIERERLEALRKKNHWLEQERKRRGITYQPVPPREPSGVKMIPPEGI